MSDFDERLQAEEKTLAGRWFLLDGTMISDITCQGIDWLVQHYLQKVADGSGGWDTLYRDPVDGRYWERTYPQSETHGGGPPKLETITVDEAERKYGTR